MKALKYLLAAAMVAALTVPSFAVTDKEMEEARAITAKAYLRYANDGSGYLDEINVKSLAELETKLKTKEKENLKAFKSVAVPKDYSTWNKDKLVEFWGTTFFTSSALTDKGKGARPRVRKKIMAMNVSAPSAATEAPQPEATQSAPETVQPHPEETLPAEAPAEPTAVNAAAEQENLLNDQKAIEKDAEEAEMSTSPKQESHTWVYIIVLAILVGLIVWLVVYAANLMKRQPSASEDVNEVTDNDELREQTRRAIAKKNEELAGVQERLSAEESRSAELSMEVERLKRDLHRQDEELSTLREENRRLRLGESSATRPAAPVRTAAAAGASAAAPAPARTTTPAEKQQLKVIYLGRANARGIFVRADRRIVPGNTIYRLDTNDGLVGTFHVVDEPEVVEVAISNPAEYLGNGCQCEDLNDTAGVERIITESAGTAIFENGYWKILRKTRIRYE